MTEARCPGRFGLLLFKVCDDGSIEIACKDCRNEARKTRPQVVMVLHRYTAGGVLVDTRELELVRRGAVIPAAPNRRAASG